MTSRPTFLLPLLALITGNAATTAAAGAGTATDVLLVSGGTVTAAGMIVCLILIRLGRTPHGAWRTGHLHSIWIFLAMVGLGTISTSVSLPETPSCDSLNTPVAARCHARVKEITNSNKGDILRLDILNFERGGITIPDVRNISMTMLAEPVDLRRGDIISFDCDLRPAEASRPEYAAIQRRERILFFQYAYAGSITVEGHSPSISTICLDFRDRIITVIEKSKITTEAGDFLKALLLGYRHDLDRETRTKFSDAGISHIIALSGLHVAIAASIALALTWPLSLLRRYKWRYPVAITLVWFYIMLTGMPLSAVRSGLMITACMTAIMAERRNSAMNSLFAATFMIILADPASLGDAGLQMSFLAVASLIAFVRHLNPIRQHIHPFTYRVMSMLLTSITATSATWVVASYYFSRVPLIFLPANLLTLPFLPVYMCLSALQITLAAAGTDIEALTGIINNGYRALCMVTDAISAGGAGALNYQAPLPVVILWLGSILSAALTLHFWKNTTGWICTGLLVAATIIAIPFTA